MNTPFKQTPGRSSFAKTGHGIPSPLRQEIELTKEYEKGKNTRAVNRAKGNNPSGMKVNSVTAEAIPNLPMHTTTISGNYLRQLDSKGGVVREELINKSTGNEQFYKNVENRNADVTNRQTKNANYYNAAGGGTSPNNLSNEQKHSLITTGKAKVVKN
jgi:hypothetical protein